GLNQFFILGALRMDAMTHIMFSILLASIFFLGCVQTATPTPFATVEAIHENALAEPSNAMKGDAKADATESMDVSTNAMADDATAPTDAGIPTGTVATYRPFTQAAFDAARADGKTIFLEFYASWCPVCATQEPQIEAAFDRLEKSDVAGFRVNYNDGDTDDSERNLARAYGVSYQHTHVILDAEGNVKTKSLEFWDAARVLSEIQTGIA
ncbi:MAG: TlpA disulfide reductase family protein, partial [Candidatus Micrarchaeota archaeon]|nr:TlpA disulfide reductase family protein [Candidatus Micrarchaeota archaeon]